ncbi:hypothetical protein A2U01_0030754, partial [Trifolium medium]|nr:hypothetical protein [Trifolium medium]
RSFEQDFLRIEGDKKGKSPLQMNESRFEETVSVQSKWNMLRPQEQHAWRKLGRGFVENSGNYVFIVKTGGRRIVIVPSEVFGQCFTIIYIVEFQMFS